MPENTEQSQSDEQRAAIVGMLENIEQDSFEKMGRQFELGDMTDPDLKNRLSAAMATLRDKYRANYTEATGQIMDADANVNHQQAVSNLQSTEAQKHIATALRDTLRNIHESNRAKIAGLNADIMTAKRIGTIHSQNLIQTRAISDNLKLTIVFACFAVIMMFLSTENVAIIPFAMAETAVLVLTFVCGCILISRWMYNMNRYNMLTQERVFEWQSEEEKKGKKQVRNACTKDEDGEYTYTDSAAIDTMLDQKFAGVVDGITTSINSFVDSTTSKDSEDCKCD